MLPKAKDLGELAMGQVFTWDALQRGHVPRLESFVEVIETLRTELPDVPSIPGALVCGSVVRGDHTIRSDIDCFVIYEEDKEHEAFEYMQQATTFAASRYVPLGFIPCDTLLAKTRMHHVGGSFLRHLQKSVEAGGLLKGDPLAEVVHSLPERDELEAYLRVKMYNLQEAWSQVRTFSEERTAPYLKKLLEAPMHIARKTLAHIEPLGRDSKSYIQNRYRGVMPAELWMQLDWLVSKDEYYTAELKKLTSTPNEEAYRKLLEYLLSKSEIVLQFIRGNLAFIAATAR